MTVALSADSAVADPEIAKALDDYDAKLREAVALYNQEKREHAASIERIRRDAKREVETFKQDFLGNFLEVLDDLDRAVEAARRPGRDQALREGIELVAQRFYSTLGRLDVVKDDEPARFDPAIHEAVAVVPVRDPADDGAIVEVLRPGYFWGDKVLRPARVAVGKLSS